MERDENETGGPKFVGFPGLTAESMTRQSKDAGEATTCRGHGKRSHWSQQRFLPTVFKKQCFSLFTAVSLARGYCISALSWSCSKSSIRLLPMSGSWHTEWLLTCVPIMASTAVPVYFEESWAILSSLGLVNVLFGLMIIGITSLKPVSIVPIVVSVAGAIANGLCYVKNLLFCSILRAPYCRERVACALSQLAPFHPKKHFAKSF